jgi:hypothetical protein
MASYDKGLYVRFKVSTILHNMSELSEILTRNLTEC